LVEKLIAQVVKSSTIIRKMSVFINYNLEIGERRKAKGEREKGKGKRERRKGKAKGERRKGKGKG
jgi:hypothetical protein